MDRGNAVAMGNLSGSVILVEPFGRGGGPDVIGRLLINFLAAAWGVPVGLENRPGGGATAGPALVAAALADGRTLLLNTSAQAYSAVVRRDLSYDPIGDFVAVAGVSTQSYALVVPARSGLETLQDLVAAARVRPGELRFASTGVGTGTHLAAEELNANLDIACVHVPPEPTDSITETVERVVRGAADYAIAPISMVTGPLSAGALVALGVTGTRPSVLLPGVPTLADAGAADYNFPVWYGIWAPMATPAAVVAELASGIAEVLASPRTINRLGEHGAEPMGLTETDFAAFVDTEVSRARRIATTADIALPD
jgi:tripartite-type tricarboxylate transporter receptor subunit TctC